MAFVSFASITNKIRLVLCGCLETGESVRVFVCFAKVIAVHFDKLMNGLSLSNFSASLRNHVHTTFFYSE